jgi:hypothetical protein
LCPVEKLQKSPLPLFFKEGLEFDGANSSFEKRGTKGDLTAATVMTF